MDAANRFGPAAETADVSLVYTCGSCALQAPAKSNFPPLMRFFLGISGFVCVCGFSRLGPEVYPRWGPGLSRCLCCVAIANETPASLQTVYCSVPVRASVRVRVCVCVSWKASLRPIADLFCKRGAVCGPATRATFRATSDPVINGRRKQAGAPFHVGIRADDVSSLRGRNREFFRKCRRRSAHAVLLLVVRLRACEREKGFFFFFYISCMFLFATPPSGLTRLLCGTNKT